METKTIYISGRLPNREKRDEFKEAVYRTKISRRYHNCELELVINTWSSEEQDSDYEYEATLILSGPKDHIESLHKKVESKIKNYGLQSKEK